MGAFGCIAMTSLTGKMPSAAGKAITVAQKPSSLVAGRPVGLEEKSSPRVLVFVISISLTSSKGLPQGNRNCVFFTGLQVKARGPQARRAGALLFLGRPTRGFVREEVHVVLLTFSCRRKTVSNLLVASLRSSSVVAIN